MIVTGLRRHQPRTPRLRLLSPAYIDVVYFPAIHRVTGRSHLSEVGIFQRQPLAGRISLARPGHTEFTAPELMWTASVLFHRPLQHRD